MKPVKVAQKVLKCRSPQALNAAPRNVGTASVTTTEIVEPAARNIIPPDSAPEFDGILFSVPGRGGCDKGCKCKPACKPPAKKQDDCCRPCGCDCEPPQGCDEHKVTCPPPPRPPQPCHCMKIISFPPKLKNCPGPCPRPEKPPKDCE